MPSPLSIRRQPDRRYIHTKPTRRSTVTDTALLKWAINDALLTIHTHNPDLAEFYAREIRSAWPGFRHA